MSEQPVDIQFALVSHTNNGKTTLARTLIGMDVGEVRDAAHVTVFAEAHTLQTSSAGDRLLLWDTPGFGDSVRLLKRLASAGNPIGWFLREVFDRYRDRPFWLSQQALRAAKDAADVVLYLVNSSEDPRDAGYLPAEMRILEWLGKPVVVLLNQLGPPRPDEQEQAEQARWKAHLDQFSIVRDVLALDAFARCWVHEDVFYERVGRVIDASKRDGYARLLAAWQASNGQRFCASVDLGAQMLAGAARDSEAIAQEGKAGFLKSALKAVGIGKDEQKRQDAAMAGLVERLERRIGDTTVGLLRLHRLDPGDAGRINARVRENFAVRAPIDKAQAGLLGAVVSGAATGLSADLMAGGLTLGGGALLGAIVGALTMAGAAWGFNTTTDRDRPTVQFADPFLRTLLVGSVLRYLAVAHFGRGRGNFVEGEAPPFWQAEVERSVARHEAELAPLWKDVRAAPDAAAASAAVQALLGRVIVETLEHLYPETAARALARADM
ncbi:GTPase domain-containing protein [Massilia sp. Root335]|uniref:GTPase domain-containing protein n=1 Tax=Massilia sp. Root335 TaxID=1736517 RepID=UPI0006FC72DB|nr:GTPase domain-containing protein [Massilia sp. Root335]KQV28969.1 GTP-binding domain-containing protein [Massilia sp. Root335]